MGVALSLEGAVALARECGSLEVLKDADGFGEWLWKPKFLGGSVLVRSRVGGEEGKLDLAEFGADIDVRSPSRYGEYPVLGRSARWGR
jgi:hypothetical protein